MNHHGLMMNKTRGDSLLNLLLPIVCVPQEVQFCVLEFYWNFFNVRACEHRLLSCVYVAVLVLRRGKANNDNKKCRNSALYFSLPVNFQPHFFFVCTVFALTFLKKNNMLDFPWLRFLFPLVDPSTLFSVWWVTKKTNKVCSHKQCHTGNVKINAFRLVRW